MIKYFKKLIFKKACNPYEDLERRINEAKKIVKYTTFEGRIFVENYQEVREVLQYEDTLGIALFIREFIARQKPTNECIKYLLKE